MMAPPHVDPDAHEAVDFGLTARYLRRRVSGGVEAGDVMQHLGKQLRRCGDVVAVETHAPLARAAVDACERERVDLAALGQRRKPAPRRRPQQHAHQLGEVITASQVQVGHR